MIVLASTSCPEDITVKKGVGWTAPGLFMYGPNRVQKLPLVTPMVKNVLLQLYAKATMTEHDVHDWSIV